MDKESTAPPAPAPEALVAAREAYARRAWDEAYEAFVAADACAPLAASDLESMAEAARWSTRFAEVVEILERAEARYLAGGGRTAAARVALRAAVEHHAQGRMGVALGCTLRARGLLENEAEDAAHGFLEWCLGRASFERGDFAIARSHLEAALAIARRQGDRDVEALARHDLGHIGIAEGRVQEGQALVDEAVALAMGGGLDRYAAGVIYCGTIWACRNRGDYQRAAEWTEVSTRWCAREAVSGFPGLCRAHRAEILRLRGDLAAAEQEAVAAVAELLHANAHMAGFAWRELGDARLRRGDLKGAADSYREAIALGTDPQPGLALLRLAEGHADGARRSLKPSLANDEYLVRSNQPNLLPAWVTILVACGDVAGARQGADELGALAETLGTAPVVAGAACAQGEVALAEGRLDEATAALRRAWRIWCDNDLPYEAARARLLLADACLAAGDREGASLELEAARQVYERLGAARDAEAVTRRLMRGAGATGHARAAAPERRVRETFLFTDIVGSTPLVEAMGDAAWSYLRDWHDRALRGCFARHRGEEIDHTGDGFFVSFASAADAVSCAVDAQSTLAAHRREHGFAPEVRIGVHAAEVSERDGARSGRGIHEAARIAAAAAGGEILVSASTWREAASDVACSEPRSLTLKGLSAPMEVVAVAWTPLSAESS